jgi:hypothetical protein
MVVTQLKKKVAKKQHKKHLKTKLFVNKQLIIPL